MRQCFSDCPLDTPLLGWIDTCSIRRPERLAYQRRELRVLLSSVLRVPPSELEVAHKPNGAPYLPLFPNLNISLSHTGAAIAAILSLSPSQNGIDIEPVSSKCLQVISKFASVREIQSVHQSFSPDLAACMLWSAKETLYKLIAPTSASLPQSFILKDLTGVDFLRAAFQGQVLPFFVHCPSMDLPQEIEVHVDLPENHVLTWAVLP